MTTTVIGGLPQAAWTGIFSFTHPPTVVACRSLCVEMQRFMQQEGFWPKLLKEHFNCNVNEAPGADPYQLYALMASQRCLRRSRLFVCLFEVPSAAGQQGRRMRRAAPRQPAGGAAALHTTVDDVVEPVQGEDPDDPPIWIQDYDGEMHQVERHIYKQVDRIVQRSGAKVGDVINFEMYRCTGWNVVGRTVPGTSNDQYYLRWNNDQTGNVPFLITKHVRNAAWMYYDIFMNELSYEVHVWLARDDDFVVALLGHPLPEGIGMTLFPSGEQPAIERVMVHNQMRPYSTNDFPRSRMYLAVRATEIPASEAADYRSFASCARANCLAVTGTPTGLRYELDMDDEQTALAVQQLRDGTSPILEDARDRTPIEPSVVVYARNLPEPDDEQEQEAEDTRVRQFYERFGFDTGPIYDEYSRALSCTTTAGGVDAAIEFIRGLWRNPAVEFRLSQPFAKRFPTGIFRHGEPAPAVVEDTSVVLQPNSAGSYRARTRPLREVTFDWKDYWQ